MIVRLATHADRLPKSSQRRSCLLAEPKDTAKSLDEAISVQPLVNSRGAGLAYDFFRFLRRPPRVGAKRGDPDFDQWMEKVLKHFKKKHGSQIKAVVAHFDESHPHLHIYVVPDDFEMSRVCVHDAAVKKVEDECKDRTDLTKKQVSNMKLAAGSQALRNWQDDYYRDVSYMSGHARLGPKRRRLTRQQWVDEQAANDLAAACSGRTHAAAVHYKREAKKLGEELAAERAVSAKYKQEAEEAQLTVGLMSGLGTQPTKPTLRSDRPAPKPAQPTTSNDFGEFGL